MPDRKLRRCFFFSSRRRHTRSKRDWSSDVCSSDLLYRSQMDVLLDPHDPEVIRCAEEAGIPHDWILAAQNSPTYKLIKEYEVALPLHPEYRTMPMVWYIPPLSPVVDVLRDTGYDAEDAEGLFAASDALR